MTTFAQLVQQMARATGLPVGVINAQVMAESGYNPNAVSPAGAEGWLQFEPGTYNQYAAQAGVAPGTEFNPTDESKVYDVLMNALLKEFGGNVQKALAAYNAGPGNIAAGMGYANGILAQAGESTSYAANAVAAGGGGRIIPGKTTTAARVVASPIKTSVNKTAPLSAPGRPSTHPVVTPAAPLPKPYKTAPLQAPGKPTTVPNASQAAAQAHAAHVAHLAHLAHVAQAKPAPVKVAPKKTVATTAKKGATGGTRIVNR